jgi:hypothetical protein
MRYKQFDMRPGPFCFVVLLAGYSGFAQAPPDGISIQVIEGEGAINSIRLHRAHEPVVRVVDARGNPIGNVAVTFLLPAIGPSGTFGDSGLSLTAFTDSRGTSIGRGLRPNGTAGEFRIRVTASSNGASASAAVMQTNAEPVIKSGRSKKIAILVVIAGAAAGGAAVAARGKSSSSAQDATTASTATGGSIVAGAPSVGPPH